MTAFQAFFLAIVQGITEFLPISSSGHLALFQKLFQLKGQLVIFDVLLHLGTLLAILFFFRKEIISLVKDWQKQKKSLGFTYYRFRPGGRLRIFLKFKN